MAERVYRIEIEGRLVELRRTEWGAEELLVDGRSVSRRAMAGWTRSSHHVDLPGDPVRHLEVRVVDASNLGVGRYVAMVAIDGTPRARVRPIKRPLEPARACLHCGYSLAGIRAVHGELRCPECGRHTPEALVGDDTTSGTAERSESADE